MIQRSANFIAYPANDALYVLKDAAERAKTLVYGGTNARFVFFQFNEKGERNAVYTKELASAEYQLPAWIKKISKA